MFESGQKWADTGVLLYTKVKIYILCIIQVITGQFQTRSRSTLLANIQGIYVQHNASKVGTNVCDSQEAKPSQ